MPGNSLPTVSVVMPTYNRAHLLPEVIQSILYQDFTDLELIIIDDGSTDETETVIKKMQEKETRLRYIRLPQNKGLGFARETGLYYATADYIALADSDDHWMPGRLRAQIEYLEKYIHLDVLFGDFLNIDHVSGKRELGFVNCQKGFALIHTHLLEPGLYEIADGLDIALLRSDFIAAPTMVMRKRVLNMAGGFNETLSATDLEFCWRTAFLGAHYAYLDRPLIKRHIHMDSMTSQGDQTKLKRFDAIEVMRQTCKRHGKLELLNHIRDTEVRTYRNLLWIYGGQKQRLKAIRIYFISLKCGFSLHTSALLLLSLMGPRALSFAQKTHKG